MEESCCNVTFTSFGSSRFLDSDSGCESLNSLLLSFDATMTLSDTPRSVASSTEDPYIAKYRLEKQKAFQRDQLVSALVVTETVDYEVVSARIGELFGRKSPISMLMEHAQYARSKVNFVEVGQPDGPDHKPTYVELFMFMFVVGE